MLVGSVFRKNKTRFFVLGSSTHNWNVGKIDVRAGNIEVCDDMPIAPCDNMASSDDQWLDINHLSFCDAYT
jgi:hypothetical protein